MSGNVVEFPTSEAAAHAPVPEAPPLPIEQHLVAAALKAERLRALSEQLLLVLQHAPGDAEMFVERLLSRGTARD
jgi:hypothetical protein